MADFSAPSFSLGLDDDDDLPTEDERERDPEEEGSPLAGPSASGHHFLGDREEEETDFALRTPEEDAPFPSPVFKRLRRGPQPSRPPEVPQPRFAGSSTLAALVQRFPTVDRHIEALSVREDCVIRDAYSLRQDHSACSSSKSSLHQQRVPTITYARKAKAAKAILSSNDSAPISLEGNNNKKLLPRLTTMPLKRIQLVDSDSDDLSIYRDKHKDLIEVDACHKENCFASTHSMAKTQLKETNVSSGKLQSENLWKGSSPKENINFETPALDEFCDEYFRVVKPPNIDPWSKGQSQQTTITSSSMRASDVDEGESHHEGSCISNSPEHNWNLPDPQPPSYQYFYHKDVRIRKLIRQCLPNFAPLGDMKCIQKQQFDATTLDYMTQFGQKEVSLQVSSARVKGFEGSLKCRSRNKNNTKGKSVADISGPWVNPRNCAIPKDVGKRLVHAAGRSSGHWYTDQGGRKVYVTKNGQELSGRVAYRHYRKETGRGFRKARKKAAGAKRKRKR